MTAKHAFLFTVLPLFLAFPARGWGQRPVAFKSAGVREAIYHYETAVKKLDQSFARAERNLEATYDVEAAKLKTSLLEKLKEAQETATKNADLDEAIKIRDAIKRFESTKNVPPNRRDPVTPHSESPKDLATENKRLQAELARLQSELARTAKTSRPELRIPREAVVWNGHHYVFIDMPMTKRVAIRYCESLGGHLARIESREEQMFVARLLQQGSHAEYWIDGSDDETEANWMLSDGTKVSPKLAWVPDQPNNRDDSQNELAMEKANGLLNDWWGGARLGVVCEWDR